MPASSAAGRACLLAITLFPMTAIGQEGQAPEKRPLDFRVLKTDRPSTGFWEFADPVQGTKRRIEIKEGAAGTLVGVLVPEGEEVLTLAPKTEGIGYRGDLVRLLTACGLDRVTVSDFLPLGDQAMARLEARPPMASCPFLEDPATARYFVVASASPVRLRAVGEITSEKVREQIGLGGQPGGPSAPIVPGAVVVESGSEMKFRGRMRSLDGSFWIEVEAILSPAAGVEPPRGYLPADSLRVSATLTLTRTSPATNPTP